MEAVPLYDRSRNPSVLGDFLAKLAVALKNWYSLGTEADKVAFVRSKCSASTTTWLDSLAPIPDTSESIVAALQAEHEIKDDERSARAKLIAQKLRGPFSALSFDGVRHATTTAGSINGSYLSSYGFFAHLAA